MRRPSAHTLRKHLRYDPGTGHLWWTIAFHCRDLTRPAGTYDNNNYLVIKFRQRVFKAHRVIWLLVTGRWPKKFIDHKNGIPDDNRWENLREATPAQNIYNSKLPKSNRAKLKGAHKHKIGLGWEASIKVKGKSKYLGYFPTPEEAHAAYVAAAKKHFGEFARTA